MSDEKNVIGTANATDTASSEAARRAEDVAQKKRDALSYAENYRQKLRDEKAQRQSPARRKADQEKLEAKEREREERRRMMEQMLHNERSTIEERKAQSTEVLQAVSEAEAERRQEQQERARIAAEEQKKAAEAAAAAAEEQKKRAAEQAQAAEEAARAQAREQARRQAEEVARAQAQARRAAEEEARRIAAEQAQAAAEAAAQEKARIAAEEQARMEEQRAAQEAAEQVRKIVEDVEAERAAEAAAAEAERAAARAAAAEQLAAERAQAEQARLAEEAAARAAAEQQAAEQVRAEADRVAAAEQAKADRAAHHEALYAEADEMAGQRTDAALAAAKKKPVIAHPVQKRATTARTPVAADDLQAERAAARAAALERVRAERAGATDGQEETAETAAPIESNAVARDVYTPHGQALEDAPAYEDAYEDTFAYEQDALSAQAAVREARLAERRAKRAMRDPLYDDMPIDYESARLGVAPPAYLPMPEESYLSEDAEVDPAQVLAEEKLAKRHARHAEKLTRKVIRGKRGLRKDEKTIARQIEKQTKKSGAKGRALQKQTLKAERTLAKAAKAERAAEKRVERAQLQVDRLNEKLVKMEQKHARKLARRPRLAAKFHAREEALSRDIVKAYKAVDRTARKEEKKAKKTWQAQAKFDRALSVQEREQSKADRRMSRIRREEADILRKTAKYDRKAARKLAKNPAAPDHAAARENLALYKKDISRSLRSASSRQLDYEERRLKKGRRTAFEAERALEAQTSKSKKVAHAERKLSHVQAGLSRYDRKTEKKQKRLDRLMAKQQAMEERDRLLLERDPSQAAKLVKRESAMARKVARAKKKLYKAQHRQDRFAQKYVDPAHDSLVRAEDKQSAEYRMQSRRMIRSKNLSDREGFRAEGKRVERRNLEEDRREHREQAAIDAAEFAALGLQTAHASRKIRMLKRQAAEAQSRERAAEVRAARSRRSLNKATAQDAVKNHKNERIVARNPKAYPAVVKQTEKNRRRLDAMEREAMRDERRLEKAGRRSEDASRKLDEALERQHESRDIVLTQYDRTVARPYMAKYPDEQKTVLREKRRHGARMTREERAYARMAREPMVTPIAEDTYTVSDASYETVAPVTTEVDRRYVRSLKRQLKKAQENERAVEARVMDRRRNYDAAVSDDLIQNHKNERTVAQNPYAYKRAVKEATKSRHRIAAMEHELDREEQSLYRAHQTTQDIARRLDIALARPTTEAQPYVYTSHPRKDTLPAWDEYRLYDAQQQALLSDKQARRAEKEARRAAKHAVTEDVVTDDGPTGKYLRRLDALYEERRRLEQKLAKTGAVAYLVRLVNLQKEICDEHFLALRTYKSRTDASALRCADEAGAEIRRYNAYITRLNDATGKHFVFAKLQTPYAILDGKSYTPIRLVKLKGVKADRRVEAAVTDEEVDTFDDPYIADSYRYDLDQPMVEPIKPAMTRREFKTYIKGVLKTNVDIEKEISVIRKRQRKMKGQALLRSQTDLLCQQKEIIDNDIALLSAAHELGYIRDGRQLIAGAKRHIRVYNAEMKQLEHLDRTRHARVDASTPSRVLAGKAYDEIPSVVCMMPGDKTPLDRFALNGNFAEIDRAMLESRYNHRIASLTHSLKNDQYDYILFADQARHSKRKKRKMLQRVKAERKMAIAAEASDNRRYESLLSFEPAEHGRRARRNNNQRMLTLRGDLKQLLVKRDDLNRELLALYSMRDAGIAMKATEQYEDGTLGMTKKVTGTDAPYVVQQRGYLTRNGKQVHSPDMEYMRVYNAEKRHQYNKNMKEVKALGKMRLPSSHPDMRALYALHNRRVDLLATINTSDRKVKIYGYKGKAASAVAKEKRAAIKELRQVNREIKGRTARTRRQGNRKPKPFWA